MGPRRLRIGIDARPLWIERGGIPRYLANMLDSLADVAPQYDYVLYTPRLDPPAHAPPSSAEVVSLSGRASRFGTVWLNTVVPLRVRPPDIDLFWAPAQIAPVAMHRAVPVVLTVHDLVWRLFPSTMAMDNRLIFPLLGRRSLERADRIVADSQATRADIIRLWSHFSDRIDVVGLGVDPSLLGSDARDTRSVLAGLDIPDEYFLSVGTLEPRKNLGFLFDIWVSASRKGVELPPLLIVGAAGWRGEDRHLARRVQDTCGAIRLLPRVSDAQLAALYRSAIALVFPSLYEGFGLPPLEAASLGTPTVCNDLPVLREGPAAEGILLSTKTPGPWVESLAALARDPGERDRLGANACDAAARFDWKTSARALAGIFDELTAG